MSTKLSPDTSFTELLRQDIPFIEINDDPIVSLSLISTTLTLLVKFGIFALGAMRTTLSVKSPTTTFFSSNNNTMLFIII